MKIFSARPEISNWYFLEYLNFADSKTVFRFLGSKTASLQRWLKTTKRTEVDPFWRLLSFDPRKIWKIWAQIWNQRSSSILKSINSIFLAQPKKSSFFSSSFFIFIFQFSKNILSIKIFCYCKNYLSNGVWLFNIA